MKPNDSGEEKYNLNESKTVLIEAHEGVVRRLKEMTKEITGEEWPDLIFNLKLILLLDNIKKNTYQKTNANRPILNTTFITTNAEVKSSQIGKNNFTVARVNHEFSGTRSSIGGILIETNLSIL